MIKVGSQFSGVGAFEQALDRLGVKYDNVYAAEWDKYARQTYLLNNEEPKWYVKDVHDTPIAKIPKLDIFMCSPPCQSFSMAGKREGENSDKGVLFYESHKFIKQNNPRYFIFENVKGLLSDSNGKTFQKWIEYLGGKSVNGNPCIFPLSESVPYHVYYKVLNAKEHGVPQNRERIFIIGIRDDIDNDFSFPKPFPLEKRLKDVLEKEVDEKYFLSDKMVSSLMNKNNQDNGFTFKPKTGIDIGNCVTARCFKMGADDNYISDKIIQLNDPKHSNDRVYSELGLSPTLNTMQGGNRQPFVQVESDSNEIINPLKDKTDYGWHFEQNVYDSKGITRALKSSEGSGNKPKVIIEEDVKIGAIRGCNPQNPLSRESGLPTTQMLEINHGGVCNSLTTVQKDNVVVMKSRIRRLTPTECFRLMDFNEEFIDKTINSKLISDSQAYKQAGNSIVVKMLELIIGRLRL